MAHKMNAMDYITTDPQVCHGQPCFKGTRVLVRPVLELIQAGQSLKQIAKAYPGVTPAHIRAAMALTPPPR